MTGTSNWKSQVTETNGKARGGKGVRAWRLVGEAGQRVTGGKKGENRRQRKCSLREVQREREDVRARRQARAEQEEVKRMAHAECRKAKVLGERVIEVGRCIRERKEGVLSDNRMKWQS